MLLDFIRWRRLALHSVSVACLVGCGRQICVAGVGDCEKMFQNDPNHPYGVGGGLAMNPQPNPMPLNGTVNLNITGGYGKLWFSFDPGNCGSVDAQNRFHAAQVGKCTVDVTDSSRPSQTFTSIINIRPI